MAREDYTPSVEDILRCRIKSLGVQELRFTHPASGLQVLLVDVGGQRTERRKWIHCFDGVALVLFVVAISEYDLLCEEDLSTNRMTESLQLFGQLLENPLFARTPVAVFYNKKDLFHEKIRRVPLSVCFPEYSGTPGDEDAAQQYIVDKFEKCASGKRKLFRYITCATDTAQMEVVWRALMDVYLTQAVGFGSAV